ERQRQIASAEATQRELEQLQKSTRELYTLRNEVTQLHKERDALKLAAARNEQKNIPSAPNETVHPVFTPGAYLKREDLAFAGYDTPAAAVQTVMYGMYKGDFGVVTNSLHPKLQEKEGMGKQQFEDNIREGAAEFQRSMIGFQLVAQKVLPN